MKKALDPDLIRVNLLVSSLYLVAYELLMLSIVEGVRDVFLWDYPRTEKEWERVNMQERDYQEMYKVKDSKIGTSPLAYYEKKASEYEREVGIKPDTPDNHALIPSCQWLSTVGALTDDDIELVRELRNYRHKVAHELPYLMINEDYDIDIDKLNLMRVILNKVEVYWFRTDVIADPKTFEEIDTSKVSDDDIFSGKEAIFQLIVNAVVEYVDQFK